MVIRLPPINIPESETIAPADVIVYRDEDYAVAVETLTRQIIAKDSDQAKVLNTAFRSKPTIVVLGDYEVDETVVIPSLAVNERRTVYLFGSIKKSSGFSGTEIIRLENQMPKLIGGLIDGVDRSVDGIVLGGSSGYRQSLVDVSVYNCDTAIKVTHDSGGINYLGYLENPHIRNNNNGLVFDGDQVHVHTVVAPWLWTYYTDGIVVRNDAKGIKVLGGLVQTGESGANDGIRVELAKRVYIKNVWIEHNGSGYAINIEPEAQDVHIEKPYIGVGTWRILGRYVRFISPWIKFIDEWLFSDNNVSFTVSGTGSYSAIFKEGGYLLSTGTTSASSAQLLSKFFAIPYGNMPYLYVRFALTDTTDVLARVGLYGGANNSAFLELDTSVASTWKAVVVKAGTRYEADTGIAPDTNYHELVISLTASAGYTEFALDGSLVAQINQVPTGVKHSAYAYIYNYAAADKGLNIEWIQMMVNHMA